MNNALRSIGMRNFLHRGVVFFILLFIFSDLSFPQVCCKEFGCSEEAGAVAGSAGSQEHPVLLVDKTSDHDQHSESEMIEKGCFCCCAHFIPGNSVFTGVVLTAAALIVPTPPGLPTSPPEDTFHPPRFS